jgi:F-type H+-transporting ATPase subunit gamma
METLERLRQRIDSLEDLQSVVHTMKALAAVSIRQYEAAAESLGDYYRTVELGLHVLLRDAGPTTGLGDRRREPRAGAVVFGSDHGLCGRFNEDIVEHAVERLHGAPGTDGTRVLAVGARAAARLEQAGLPPEADFTVPGAATRLTATVQRLLLQIDAWQEEGVDHVYLFYNRHGGGAQYRPTGIELLPVELHRFARLGAEPWPSRRLPTYSQDHKALTAHLLRQYFFVTVYRACAESLAAEHGSRLAAMQAAERNLADRLAEVGGAFRRVRQHAITTELLDVVAGFEALAGDGDGDLEAERDTTHAVP